MHCLFYLFFFFFVLMNHPVILYIPQIPHRACHHCVCAQSSSATCATAWFCFDGNKPFASLRRTEILNRSRGRAARKDYKYVRKN